MIPIRLQLKNFLSYGDPQTINFSPYGLICLSGKNGHGKSALLDAMTWALWGQARKTGTSTKPDQGLLKLGQSTMTVCLDFMFNGQEYRVRREFSITQGKISTKIDFGMIDATDASTIDRDLVKVRALSGKTSRETQEIIERTLNLDFESFAHSSFLRQGQASEFSKKSPKERKEILAAILGLKKYDTIKQAALDKVREAQNEKGARNAVLEKNQQQLAQKNELEELFTITNHKLSELHKEHATCEKEIAALNTEEKRLNEQHREQAIIAAHKQQLLTALSELKNSHAHEASLWRATHRKLKNMADPAQIDRKRQMLLKLVTEQQEALQKQLTLKQEVLELTMQLTAREGTLKQEHSERMATVSHALERARAEQRDILQQRSQINAHHEKIRQQQAERTRTLEASQTLLKRHLHNATQLQVQEEQFEKRKAFYQRLSTQGKYLSNELATLERKQHDLHDDGPSSCPLCEQNLSAARKRFLRTQTVEQHAALKRRLHRMSIVLSRLKQLLIEQHETLMPLKKAREDSSIVQARMNDLLEQKKLFESEEQEILTLKKTLEERAQKADEACATLTDTYQAGEKKLEELIAHDEACVLARTKLSVLELVLTKTLYHKETHEQALQELSLLAQEQEYLSTLKNEAAQQLSRKQRLSELRAAVRAQQQSLKAVEQSLTKFEHLAADEADLITRKTVYNEKLKQLHLQQQELFAEQARLALKRETIALLEKECAEEIRKIADIDEQITDYQAIALATGKDGIQALIIEQALPEIENEANTLLGRLTNNQAHVSIESLRDLKKGGSKETLDINISDSLGVRPYELYSGGEAFRIDFALRIAISKLLARRAGTSLQTLIIDEGFGSQDEEGLSKIMDAIHAIKDDFAMVIIVSHLPSMKDQFPVHFMVEKEANGSRVQVFQQG